MVPGARGEDDRVERVDRVECGEVLFNRVEHVDRVEIGGGWGGYDLSRKERKGRKDDFEMGLCPMPRMRANRR